MAGWCYKIGRRGEGGGREGGREGGGREGGGEGGGGEKPFNYIIIHVK